MSDATKVETDAEKVVGCVLTVALPFTGAYHAVVSGFVVRTLWGWFVVPAFAVATPPLPLVIGLLLIVAWLRIDLTPSKDRPFSEILADMVRRALLTATLGGVVLLEGWIIQRVWL